MRKAFKAAIKEFKPSSMGNDAYSFAVGDSAVTLMVDFGSKLAQFRYTGKARNAANTQSIYLNRYELLWDVSAEWDYLTEENAARSMAALPDIVRYIVSLNERIDALKSRVHEYDS